MDYSKLFNSQNKNRISITLSDFILKIKSLFSSKEKDGKWQSQTDLDKKLIYSLSNSRIPNLSQIKYLKKFLSWQELFLIRLSLVLIILSLVLTGTNFYKKHLQETPVKGGEYAEGLIGMPKYINPLYSKLSDVDNDITGLVFSSLFKRGKNGELAEDVAESLTISPDNKIYTITIKDDIKWHNGSSLSVRDIIFTFGAIKDPKYKSVVRSAFNSVEIEEVDDKTIRFILPEPYAAFLELLTFGIMPSELWNQIPPESASLAELNLRPIGSGPYRFNQFTKDKTSGAIVDYSLIPNDDYYQAPPLLDLKFRFYPNFEEAVAALKNNSVDGLSYLPKEMEKNITVTNSYNFFKLHIPQLTLIYFNDKSNPALASKELRQALAMAIDRNEIVSGLLGGEASLAEGPILQDSFAYDSGIRKYENKPDESAKILDNLGWKQVEITAEKLKENEKKAGSKNEKEVKAVQKILDMGAGKWREKDGNYLTIKLTTVDRAENQRVIEAIKSYWENIGVKTSLEIYPPADIQKSVIKSRNFEALFYGLVVGADPDPYVFWHSSQAGENGFNISNFANKDADQLLEDARLIVDKKVRQEKYKKFQEIIAEAEPAIFMYSPTYTYVQSKKVKSFEVASIVVPVDRFSNVTEWYMNTGKKIVW